MITKKTIADVEGVYTGAVRAGIRSNNDTKDLAYIFVPESCATAGVTTQNTFAAPCIHYTKEKLTQGVVKAVIVNAGNANAATGEQGLVNTVETAEIAAEKFRIAPNQVVVASTGVIGKQLPMDKVRAGLEDLLANTKQKDGDATAEAILTTDLCQKTVCIKKEIAGENVCVAGIAKGSGMIAPNMATMLGFLVTDVKIEQARLELLLQKATDESFNMVSVDTDTSTNDLVLAFASGVIDAGLQSPVAEQEFYELLRDACVSLAKQIAKDGEGAEKLIEVYVSGANNECEARVVAKSVVDSPLVKTAIHGSDPNWGRIIMAVGKCPGLELDPDRIEIRIGDIAVFSGGQPCNFDNSAAHQYLLGEEVQISVSLGPGSAEARAWGCDLTKGYIDINTEYN